MSPSDRIAIVWFRRDLRLIDNPAWAAATRERDAVVPLFVLDPRMLGSVGPYRRRYLVASLQALDYEIFEQTQGRLLVRVGDATTLVPEAADVLQAGAVYWNGDTTPLSVARDAAIREALGPEVVVRESWGTLVAEPGTVVNARAQVPSSFGAFLDLWRLLPRRPWGEPGDAIIYDEPGEPLPRLDGRPPIPEGEHEAARRLEVLVARIDEPGAIDERVDRPTSSRLSADLRFGIISPRTVLDAVGTDSPARETFSARLARRDWYAHRMGEGTLRGPEAGDEAGAGDGPAVPPVRISAWKGGFTGYPLVDAAMRELRETGWMHDSLRRLVATFLVGDLEVDWQIGEAHFRHLLVDADVPLNRGNWLEAVVAAARGGVDPTDEARRLDPEGTYIRRWVPELAALGAEHIHTPWDAGDGSADYAPRIVNSRSTPDEQPAPSDD